MEPRTVYELLKMLETYHQQRHDSYLQLASRGTDERACILLHHLGKLEENAINIIRDERDHLKPDQATYLTSGPTLTIAPSHAMDCKCDGDPTFDDALRCALTSDDALDELIDRLAGSSAAASIQDLATRLRDVERTKDREIAKFTRED